MFMPMMSFPKRYIYTTGIVIIAPQTKLSFSRHFITKNCPTGQSSSNAYSSCHSKCEGDKQHQQAGRSDHSHIRPAGFGFTLGNPAIAQIPAEFWKTEIDDTEYHEYKKEGSHTHLPFSLT
ncbi:hypothetical protein [Paenibacillus xylanexedens]|uniref:hypothetical protein n=1 Tax=Paenibacillus xylanexedens TaxID=528191 RepID=UPI0012F4E7AA|nr:hypothetical protein [Paenibacillus xylanexedens]